MSERHLWLSRRQLIARVLAAGAVPMATHFWTIPAEAGGSAHDFSLPAIEGGDIRLADYAGQPVLLVNTASLCGFTPQYESLQTLWERYRGEGLVVLGVPSDNFGGQEYDSNEEVQAFCETNFGIDFPLAAKQDVRGSDAHPLYHWLAESYGEGAIPRWNFHKILIDTRGQVVGAWPSRVEPDGPEIIAAIEAALSRN